MFPFTFPSQGKKLKSLIFLRGCFVLGNSAKRKSIFYHFGRKCLSSLFPIPDIVLAWQFIRRHRLTRSLEREILWMTSAIFLPSFCFSQIGTIDTLERPLEAAFLPSRTFLQFSFSVSLDPCYLFCFLFSRLSKFQKRSNLQSLPEVLWPKKSGLRTNACMTTSTLYITPLYSEICILSCRTTKYVVVFFVLASFFSLHENSELFFRVLWCIIFHVKMHYG